MKGIFKFICREVGNGLMDIFYPAYLTVPFGTTNHKFTDHEHFTGCTCYRVFGFRILKIQQTKPWEH